jgi:TrmH family RNA methyltransferase
VREALGSPARTRELFVTAAAAGRNADLVERARAAGVVATEVTEKAAELLSETVTPQGIVAVCDAVDVALADALVGSPRLVAVLVGVSDPGNAGTVLRVADAAGADAVVFAGDSVDPHNGKCVRSSTGIDRTVVSKSSAQLRRLCVAFCRSACPCSLPVRRARRVKARY